MMRQMFSIGEKSGQSEAPALGVEWLQIFLKSTFMWWKSSRSRLVADDVINEQISL